MFEDNYPDTCLSCGLLGVVAEDVHGNPLQEYKAADRAAWRVGSSRHLWCFRRMAYPSVELADLLIERRPEQEAVQNVLQRHRQPCVEQGVWTKYEEFFTPKEHYEWWRMMELENLRQQQSEIMLRIAMEQKEIVTEHARTASYHLEMAEKLATISERADEHATDFNQQSIDFNNQARRVNRWLVWLGIVTALIGVGTLVLAGVQVYQATTDAKGSVVVITPTSTPTATRIPATATPLPPTPDTIPEP